MNSSKFLSDNNIKSILEETADDTQTLSGYYFKKYDSSMIGKVRTRYLYISRCENFLIWKDNENGKDKKKFKLR